MELISTLIILFLILALQIVYGVILYMKRTTMTEDATNERFGSLSLGIRNLTIWQAYYSIIFLQRRVIFAFILVDPYTTPQLVVAILILLNVAYIYYLGQV